MAEALPDIPYPLAARPAYLRGLVAEAIEAGVPDQCRPAIADILFALKPGHAVFYYEGDLAHDRHHASGVLGSQEVATLARLIGEIADRLDRLELVQQRCGANLYRYFAVKRRAQRGSA